MTWNNLTTNSVISKGNSPSNSITKVQFPTNQHLDGKSKPHIFLRFSISMNTARGSPSKVVKRAKIALWVATTNPLVIACFYVGIIRIWGRLLRKGTVNKIMIFLKKKDLISLRRDSSSPCNLLYFNLTRALWTKKTVFRHFGRRKKRLPNDWPRLMSSFVWMD